MYAIDNNELYHHGIKGQKWGVRRFQNEDGSVTAKGAKRYYDGDIAGTGGRSIMSNQKIKKPGFVKGGPEKLNTEKFIKGGTTPIGSKLRKGAGVVKNKISDKHTEKNEEEKSEKKGLSKKQKAAIGVGIAAVAAVGAYAAGVKIADVKANKAANKEIASMLESAKLHSDISLHQAKLAQKSANKSDFDSLFRGAAQQRSKTSNILDDVKAVSNYGGRKGKKVKLSKENTKALNKLVNDNKESAFRIENLVKDSSRKSRFN